MSKPAGTFDASKLKGIGIKPLVSLRKHPRAALAALVAVVVVGTPLAWVKGTPKYMANATVQVAPRYMKTLKEDDELAFQSNSQYREFVVNQARSVNRYDILEQALKQLGPRRAIWQKPGETDRKAIERLQERLVVITVPDTYMLQILIEDGNKDGLDELVNAVVESYMSRMRDEQMYGADERVKHLLEREKELLKYIRAATERRTGIAIELGITSFTDGAGNPYDRLLTDSRSGQTDARKQRYLAEAKLNAFLSKGETDITMRSIKENILADPGLNSLKSALNNRRAVLVSTLAGLTKRHPSGAAARAELAEIDAEINRQSDKLAREVSANLRARYEMTVEQARHYEHDLDAVLAEQEAASAKFAKLFNEAATLSADLAQSRKELETLRDRLNFFAIERGAIGFVRLIAPALKADTPYGPGRKKLLLMVLLAAGVLALVVPIGIDMMDRRIRTVSDAERTLGLPALGWLVERDGGATDILAEDQLRRLAAGLLRERDRHGSSVFGLCGVKPGGGTTSITLQLAQTLHSMGYPSLAVEANAFNSDARYENRRPGLAQCLDGNVAALGCVAPPNGVLPARVKSGANGSQNHLSNLGRLEVLLAEWGQQYRFVLVDIPPLLLSADAEIMLSRLGQILLVVEANAINKGELARAARVLDNAGAKAVGLVVNRIEPLAGGGYLRDVMIEQLTGKKFTDFQTLPEWKLRLQIIVPDALQRLARRLRGRISLTRRLAGWKARCKALLKRPHKKDPS